MATFTNATKHTATIIPSRKTGITTWDDSVRTWDDTEAFWADKLLTFTNQDKHTATINNITKN